MNSPSTIVTVNGHYGTNYLHKWRDFAFNSHWSSTIYTDLQKVTPTSLSAYYFIKY